jgi:hypothetical protein
MLPMSSPQAGREAGAGRENYVFGPLQEGSVLGCCVSIPEMYEVRGWWCVVCCFE